MNGCFDASADSPLAILKGDDRPLSLRKAEELDDRDYSARHGAFPGPNGSRDLFGLEVVFDSRSSYFAVTG